MKREYVKPEMKVYCMETTDSLMQTSQTIGIVNDDADPNIDILMLDDEDNNAVTFSQYK